ncbi:hypothetical protein K4749_16255 [Streptomyces sp. TRM72054]|uniref:DUF6508 domain-containing protein n=1 Tax=Streptomyces sp. TRM72054 TaxID=2870562 RepID=UPI001C8C3EBE|nr:DUF6508 domain-containing protein [Streptomyces sp. TRM72054]MBX9395108.1 hypothetical protein [Streptomyces sp. TRM72054]
MSSPSPVHYVTVTAPDGELAAYLWVDATAVGWVHRPAGSSGAYKAGEEWHDRARELHGRGLAPRGVLSMLSREPGVGPVTEAPDVAAIEELARVVTPDDDRRLLNGLDRDNADAWRELADAFDALTDEDRDIKWGGGQKLADGVYHVAFPLYSQPLERAVRALSGVGAVTPEYRWVDSPMPEPSPDGRLSAADAVRAATAVVRRERFSDGTIAAAVKSGLLDAVVASLRAWYAEQPSVGPGDMCRFCGGSPAADVTFRAHRGLVILMGFRKTDGPMCFTCGLAVYRAYTTHTLCVGWWSPLSLFVFAPLTLVRNVLAVRRVKRLPAPGPGTLGPRYDPGVPVHRRPRAYVALVPVLWVLFMIVTGLSGAV